MIRNNRFNRGSATYHCRICNRLTRETGVQGGTELCPQCHELSGMENIIYDRCGTIEELAPERDRLAAELGKHGIPLDIVKLHFDVLWIGR